MASENEIACNSKLLGQDKILNISAMIEFHEEDDGGIRDVSKPLLGDLNLESISDALHYPPGRGPAPDGAAGATDAIFSIPAAVGGSNDYFRDICSVTRSNSIIGSVNSSVPQVSGAETSNYSVCMSKNNVSGATEVSFSTPTAVGSRQIG